MKRERRKDAGFSLLETLLGLTLTAMIGVLMMGSLQMGARVWERERKAEQPGVDQLIYAQTTEWLAHAMPMNLRNLQDNVFVPFHGEPRLLSFLYSAPGMGQTPGIYAIDLALVEANGCENGLDLIMRATRVTLAQEDMREVAPHVERRRLASCLSQPSFVYWGAQPSDVDYTWRNDWVQQSILPVVVRLRSMDAEGAEHAVFTQRLLNGAL